jgi:mRNA interferase MazF
MIGNKNKGKLLTMKQYNVYWVNLNPTLGSEMNKVRPAVIISPDELNSHLKTVLIAPVTSTVKRYPFRVNCVINNRNASIALDQIRTIDKLRLQQPIEHLNFVTVTKIKQVLKEMLID